MKATSLRKSNLLKITLLSLLCSNTHGAFAQTPRVINPADSSGVREIGLTSALQVETSGGTFTIQSLIEAYQALSVVSSEPVSEAPMGLDIQKLNREPQVLSAFNQLNRLLEAGIENVSANVRLNSGEIVLLNAQTSKVCVACPVNEQPCSDTCSGIDGTCNRVKRNNYWRCGITKNSIEAER